MLPSDLPALTDPTPRVDRRQPYAQYSQSSLLTPDLRNASAFVQSVAAETSALEGSNVSSLKRANHSPNETLVLNVAYLTSWSTKATIVEA